MINAMSGHPPLKPSEWYEVIRLRQIGELIHRESFFKAAVYNTKNGNSHLYSEYYQKQAYYGAADILAKAGQIDVAWFRAAARVVDAISVVEWDAFNLFTDGLTRRFLKNISELVFEHAMDVGRDMLLNPDAYQGSNGGLALDKRMLFNEQSLIQKHLDENAGQDTDHALDKYNSAIDAVQWKEKSGHYLNVAEDILGSELDFSNLTHRLIIGAVLIYEERGIQIGERERQEILDYATKSAAEYGKAKSPDGE
jgi:hypothetical protein